MKKTTLFLICNLFILVNSYCQIDSISIIAGNTISGFKDTLSLFSEFNKPVAMVLDDSLNMYIADRNNYKIRKISKNGNVTTYAGTGVQGAEDGSGDVASFYYLKDITIDKFGVLYVIDGSKVRRIDKNRQVKTLSYFTISSGELHGIVADSSGKLFVSYTDCPNICWGTSSLKIISLKDSSISSYSGKSFSNTNCGKNCYSSTSWNPLAFTINENGDLLSLIRENYFSNFGGYSDSYFIQSINLNNLSFDYYKSGYRNYYDIDVDIYGNVYVATNNSIIKINAITKQITTVDSLKNGENAIHIDRKNHVLYVVESYNNVIKKIILKDEVLGISQDIQNNVKIYPSPSKGTININLSVNNTVDYLVQLFDLQGKRVFQDNFKGSEYSINTLDFENGIYFLKIMNDKTILTEKIVISK